MGPCRKKWSSVYESEGLQIRSMTKFRSDRIVRPDGDGSRDWEPEAKFLRADFPVEKPQEKRESRKDRDRNDRHDSRKENPPAAKGAKGPDASKGDPHGKKGDPSGIRAFLPPTVASGAEIFHRNTSESEPESKNQTGAKVSEVQANQLVDIRLLGLESDPFLKRAIRENPEAAVDRLRRWYWEKSQDQKGALHNVDPRVRIFIVLVSAGKTLVQYLYSIMTPVERRQFHDLLKQPPRVTRESVEQVRREFARLIQGGSGPRSI